MSYIDELERELFFISDRRILLHILKELRIMNKNEQALTDGMTELNSNIAAVAAELSDLESKLTDMADADPDSDLAPLVDQLSAANAKLQAMAAPAPTTPPTTPTDTPPGS